MTVSIRPRLFSRSWGLTRIGSLYWIARQRNVRLETKRRALRSLLSPLGCKAEGPAVEDKEKGTTFTVSFGLQGRGTCCWRQGEGHYVHCRGHHAECGLIGLFEMKYFVSKVLNYLSISLCYFWECLETALFFCFFL